MRFGFFDQLPCASGFTERQRYKDIMAQIDLGDELGFDTVWLGELHFGRAFSILADPLMVLAAAAQRTTRIRLGTAVVLLPLHHPVKIAEEAAIADILSDGRLELGCGRGTAPLHYEGYAIPQEESRERFEEALDFILQAWTKDSFSYEGKHFRAHDLSVVPRPVQSPHPPVRIAANSPDTFPFSGRRKLPIFATPPDQSARQAQGRLGGLPRNVARRHAGRYRARFSGPCRGEPSPGATGLRGGAPVLLAGSRGAVAAARTDGHQELRGVSSSIGPHRADKIRGF